MSHDDKKSSEESKDVSAIIALGANLPSTVGEPRETLERALTLLTEAGLCVKHRSQWYTSPAWPAGSGPDYVNGASLGSGEGDMATLLALLQRIEGEMGRTRKAGRWDARVCDLDLIDGGAAILPDLATWQAIADSPAEAERPGLVLPHPLMHLRAFVLVPVAEIAAEWVHPVLGQTMAALRDGLPHEEVAAITPFAG